MAVNTKVRVWLSHDGYRDPDDNLAMLVGGAQAKMVANASDRVSVAGFVYGDTKDGGQYYMLNPTGKAPKAFGTDSRYGDVAGNKVAAGNYEFFVDYGKAAIKNLGSWDMYNLIASDRGGQRAWNFDGRSKDSISGAAGGLADDIRAAIKGGNEVVVYSAGGGANVPAEAIAYLYNQGVRKADIADHFAIVQHGRSNWSKQYENEARDLTRDFTIALSNQNMARYANGMAGPDLKHAVKPGTKLDGSAFGSAFDKALDVALGVKGYVGLKAGTTFKTTTDASDAGSHAFAVDVNDLLAAMKARMHAGDTLPLGDNWAHRIDGNSGARLRVIYDEFDAKKIAQLLDGDRNIASAAPLDLPGTGTGSGSGSGSGVKAAAPGAGSADGDAPFATGGASVGLGGATLYGFGADGKAARVVSADGKVGVAATGDANTIDHTGRGSEEIGLDFGAAVEAITLRLAGLSSKGAAQEAAKFTTYDADGDVLDSWLFTKNGQVTVETDGAHYATLEAADWIGGSSASDPDFALVSIGLHYDV
jgi:hypothetical protein